jgi:hypothetical protein
MRALAGSHLGTPDGVPLYQASVASGHVAASTSTHKHHMLAAFRAFGSHDLLITPLSWDVWNSVRKVRALKKLILAVSHSHVLIVDYVSLNCHL